MRPAHRMPSLVRTAIRLTVVAVVLGGAARADAQAAARATVDSSYRAPASVVGLGPNGATLRCRDGSYPAPLAPDSACDDKGGILARFPLRRIPAPIGDSMAAATTGIAPAPVPTAPALILAPEPESRAHLFVPAEPPPADATLLCRDGTFIRADTSAARCATRGGVSIRFPPPRRGR